MNFKESLKAQKIRSHLWLQSSGTGGRSCLRRRCKAGRPPAAAQEGLGRTEEEEEAVQEEGRPAAEAPPSPLC